MKTMFTLLIASLLAVTSYAADVTGRVIISIQNNRDYQVLIDGHAYASAADRLYLSDLRPGRHTLQVFTSGRKRNSREVYSTVFLLHPRYDVNISINRDGQALVQEQSNVYNDKSYGRDRRNDDSFDDDRYDRNNKSNGNGNRYGHNRNSRHRTYTDDFDRNNNSAMPDYEFNNLLQKIQRVWFANEKMNMANDAFTRSNFTTYQVRQVLQLFSFENDKLQLAKRAYHRTVDRQQFGQVYDVFALQSSRDELDRYIQAYR